MHNTDTLLLEPGRFDLEPPAQDAFGLDRRDFFKSLGLGVMVLFIAPAAIAQEAGTNRRGRGGRASTEISAWIHIGEDGAITVYTGKTEIGQNIRTSLTQAVAEELRVPVATIKMVMADTDLVPFDQGTFGSQTTPQMASNLHRVAATARELLVDMAADHFKAERSTLTVADGKISKTGGDSVTFGQLTQGQKLTKVVDNSAPVTPPSVWKIAGTSVPKVDGRDFVTGRHKYTPDIKMPGMLFGKVARPATYGATPVTVDAKDAEAMEGVKVVHEGDFIAVTAPDSLTASDALDAIKVEWTPLAGQQPSSTDIYDYLRRNATAGGGGRGGRGGRGGGGGGRGGGSPDSPFSAEQDSPAADGLTLKKTYTVAYIAHVPLEPRAALADWKPEKLTVWVGTQRPFGVQTDIAQALGIPAERIRVIVPDTGSGYGGKHTAQQAIEASRLSRTTGKPVKVVWTRQEEFTWAYFRPAGVIDVTSAVRNDGTITSWEFYNYNSGPSAVQSPYNIPGQRSEYRASRSPLSQNSYRGLAGTANHFARETHMDELARLVKMDPLEFRLKNLTDARLRGVLEAAAKAFGWGAGKAAPGHGFGIAGGTEKGSYIASCAEVMADAATGTVKVVRAVSAFDCGAVVNPNHLKNQIEGALVMGLGGALFEAIEFKDGMITNPHLADYRVPRFDDAPKIEIVLVDRKDVPSAGAGETPIMAIAPAVGNAIFAASGIRLRSLPMVPDGLKG